MGMVISRSEDSTSKSNSGLKVSVSAGSPRESSITTPKSNSSVAMSPERAVALVMPIYYTKADLTAEEREAAVTAWKMIINNRCEHFSVLKEQARIKEEDFPHVICSDYFSTLFYDRLFQVHPLCKGLFANSKMKMRMNFMSIITLLLNALEEEPTKFVKTLENLAKVHNTIGVRAVEYGIGCECLMYCIQMSIGSKEWTPVVSRAWTKIFSRILDIIIPIVVKYEMECPEATQQLLAKRQVNQSSEGGLRVTSVNTSD